MLWYYLKVPAKINPSQIIDISMWESKRWSIFQLYYISSEKCKFGIEWGRGKVLIII